LRFQTGSIYADSGDEKIAQRKWINWDDAKLHVLSHVVSYGWPYSKHSLLRDQQARHLPSPRHMQRLINSAKNYRMDFPTPSTSFPHATELVRANKLNSCYVKPSSRGLREVE